jgi:hypothetical protein
MVASGRIWDEALQHKNAKLIKKSKEEGSRNDMMKVLPSFFKACRKRSYFLLSLALLANRISVFFIFHSQGSVKNDSQRFLTSLVEDESLGARLHQRKNAQDSFPHQEFISKTDEEASNENQLQILEQNYSAEVLDNLSDGEPLPPLRLCGVKTKQMNNPRTPMNDPIGVPYQCAGPSYDFFSKRLMKLISNPLKYGKDLQKWGRRNMPFPPNNRVIFLGNSHLRQVFQSLMCQYQQEIISATQVSKVDDKGSGIWDVRLRQNVTVYGAFNIPQVYSPRWTDLLTGLLNRSLNSLDMVVLGRFNGFGDSKGTAFSILMKNLTAMIDADFEKRKPPNVDEVAAVYSGPILAVSTFANHDAERTKNTIEKIRMLHERGRENIAFIDGRKYVQFLGECATDKFDIVGTCSKDFTTLKSRGKNGHRCVGENGGHPDLLSWDIVEAYYQLINGNN